MISIVAKHQLNEQMRTPFQAHPTEPVQAGRRPGTPNDLHPPNPSALDESWCPVGTPTHSDSGQTDDEEDDIDDISSVTLGSSLVLSSNGSNGTRREEEGLSSADELDGIDGRPPSPVASDLLGGESYIDAEAPSTILPSPSARSAASTQHMPLIYPYSDLEHSFDSSTTASDTTPNASVGALQPVLVPGHARRSSRYRLENRSASVAGLGVDGMGENSASTISPFIGFDRPAAGNQDRTTLPSDPVTNAKDGVLIEEMKQADQGRRTGTHNPRLRLAVATARGIRQRWCVLRGPYLRVWRPLIS